MTQFAFVFPGQGSQTVGMLDAWGDHAMVRDTLAEASQALGEDLGALIHAGPKEQLALGIPPGRYRAEWLRPTDGRTVRTDTHDHPGGSLVLTTPIFSEDLALHLAAK